jgi:hypothetical protein
MKKIAQFFVSVIILGFTGIVFGFTGHPMININPGGPVRGLRILNNKNISLTIYNQNLALIREVKSIILIKGSNTIEISTPALIEPESVYFQSLTNPQGCVVLSQNFENNIVNPENLLDRYIGKQITVITKNNVYQGELLSAQPGEIIIGENMGKGPLFLINRTDIENIEFSKFPQGFLLKPKLVLNVDNNNSGLQKIEIDYLTTGINWNSNYVAILSKDEKQISLLGWATIDNKSGTSYKNVNIKLVAGQVHLIQQYNQPRVFFGTLQSAAMPASNSVQLQQKPSFEYYIYTLNRKTTIKNNQTKQISFLKKLQIPVKKIYTYDGAGYSWYYYNNWTNQPYNKNVSVNIKFKNSKANNLGIPLPSGTVRVYKEDKNGELQFIGEDQINNIPNNETVSLYPGNAFNITGKREITSHKVIASNIYQDSYKIILKNQKKQQITVNVLEHQFGQWQIIKSSMPYKKINASTIKFKVTIAPGESSTITYTSEYKF